MARQKLRSLRLKDGDEAEHLADIAAIDRVLVNVLGFDGDIEAVTRDFRREALFGRNELRRAVAGILREANGPLTARQITERVLASKEGSMLPGRDAKLWITRVRKVCSKLPVEQTWTEDGLMAWTRNGK